MKSYFYLVFISLLAILGLLSCSNNDAQNSNSSTKKLNNLKKAPNGNVYYGGMFNENEVEYIRTLYPLNLGEVTGHRTATQIYEGLFTFNPETLAVQPLLAETYTVSPDGLTYSFTIKKGVLFHDNACFEGGKGREATIKDFKFCFDLLCTYSPDNRGYQFVKDRIVGASAYYEASKKNEKLPENGVEGVKIIDENTLQITLNQPFGGFLSILALPYCYLFPPEAYKKYGKEMRTNAVGTGPFYLKAIKENEAIILLKNPNYWRKDKFGNQLPYLDGIKISFINDQMAELRELSNGNLDMIYRLPAEVADEIVDRQGILQEKYQNYQYQQKTSLDIQYYGFLNAGKIFNNKPLRQAFCYAIDRQKICDLTLKGSAEPALHGIVPPSMTAYPINTLKGYTFNPNTAKELLAKAGFANGQGFPPLTLQLNSGGKRNEQVAEAIQKMLQENLNININIIKVPFAQHLESLEAGKVDFYRMGWLADYPDPENFLSLFYGKNAPETLAESAYLNTFRYKNAAYDALYLEALKTNDVTKRNELYAKAEQLAIDDAVVLPLYHSKDQRLLQKYVQNFPQNAMEFRYFGEVYFAPNL